MIKPQRGNEIPFKILKKILKLHREIARLSGETSNTGSSRRFNETTAAKHDAEKSIHISLRELYEMAHMDFESSNALFEALEDWNDQLKDVNFDIDTDLGGPSL